MSNPRGIPKAFFVANVDEFMQGRKNADEPIHEFEEQYKKYKFMEANTIQRKKQVASKLPELNATIDMLDYLILKRVIFLFFFIF